MSSRQLDRVSLTGSGSNPKQDRSLRSLRKIQLFHKLAALSSWLAFRRFVTVLCAVAFVMTSSAHAMHHFEGFDGKSNVEIGAASDINHSTDPDTDGKTAGADQHACCGCAAVVLLEVAQLIVALRPASFIAAEVSSLQPRGPTLDTPYPISTI